MEVSGGSCSEGRSVETCPVLLGRKRQTHRKLSRTSGFWRIRLGIRGTERKCRKAARNESAGNAGVPSRVGDLVPNAVSIEGFTIPEQFWCERPGGDGWRR